MVEEDETKSRPRSSRPNSARKDHAGGTGLSATALSAGGSGSAGDDGKTRYFPALVTLAERLPGFDIVIPARVVKRMQARQKEKKRAPSAR